jgi:hypothetical protein
VTFNHVRQDKVNLLGLDSKDRIPIMLEDVWVDYAPSERIFKIMNNIAQAPKRITAPALLVGGTGGVGKSAIVKQIHRRVVNSDGLIFVNMSVDPDQLDHKRDLKTEIYKELGIPLSSSRGRSGASGAVPQDLIEVMNLRSKWGLVIDEFHDLLLVGKQEQRVNGSMLKTLLSEPYGMKLFAFGAVGARRVLNAKSETKRRFTEVILGDWTESEEFRSFLLGLEQCLPLREPSKLYEKKLTQLILVSTAGRMDKVIDLVRSAGCYALSSGKEYIDEACLIAAAADPWGF